MIIFTFSIMDLETALKNQQLKKKLQNKKQDRIKKRLMAKQREKANLDQTHLKTGKIQKNKTIKKKTFATEVQKARKIQAKIQQNANPSTFVAESQQYLTILDRTRNYISFDQQKLKSGCEAIVAYASANNQHTVFLELTLEKAVQCNQTPVLLRLSLGDTKPSCIVITNQKQEIETKAITNADIRIMTPNQFRTKCKEDKKFKKSVTQKIMKIFCDWKIYSSNNLPKRLLSQNLPIFPIDLRKVPFSLQDQLSNYHQYLNLLLSSAYAICRPGTEHRVRLKLQQPQTILKVIPELTHQMVARLIQKSKVKGNRLLSARLKTTTSIPIDIY